MKETNYLVAVGVPIATFVLGFFTSRFTMTKKERKDHQQTLYENASDLAEKQKVAYTEFTDALATYISADEPRVEDFLAIATSGDRYFSQLKMTAEAILSDNVDPIIRDETLIPALKEAIEKSLPAYYEALIEISRKRNIDYSGDLSRSNYESIYSAVEKHPPKYT